MTDKMNVETMTFEELYDEIERMASPCMDTDSDVPVGNLRMMAKRFYDRPFDSDGRGDDDALAERIIECSSDWEALVVTLADFGFNPIVADHFMALIGTLSYPKEPGRAIDIKKDVVISYTSVEGVEASVVLRHVESKNPEGFTDAEIAALVAKIKGEVTET